MYFLLISADSNSRLGSADPQQNEPILLGLRRKSETFQAVRIQWGQLVLSEATTNSSLLHGCLTCDDEHQQKKPHNIPGMHGDWISSTESCTTDRQRFSINWFHRQCPTRKQHLLPTHQQQRYNLQMKLTIKTKPKKLLHSLPTSVWNEEAPLVTLLSQYSHTDCSTDWRSLVQYEALVRARQRSWWLHLSLCPLFVHQKLRMGDHATGSPISASGAGGL
jgi:hypothetical protein